ncbi:hypothetical protein ASH00_16130 [Arthrobacter sp. Soil782]|uniref:hypothetical protein n=1 Tax=Arthrobacter sp. Soil782 TaxID=1736410 RepID=UPI0006F69E5A|nr:hypothetical protein [Arthrobacter sp. Soil782]KRF07072.1 hypothetical protein ASH00_16130 [Arthrobacter sp. Soil782]
MSSSKSPVRRFPRTDGEQEPLLAGLEAKYQNQGLRFDTGFYGSVPVQSGGRIGRRYFYFRSRHDCAALTIGYPDRRAMAGRDKRSRLKHRRALRREKYERGSFDHVLAEMLMYKKQESFLSRHPSNEVAYASISGVTGDPYAGTLTTERAVELFEQLLAGLKPVDLRMRSFRNGRKVFQRSSTIPMPEHSVVIVKPSKRRR